MLDSTLKVLVWVDDSAAMRLGRGIVWKISLPPVVTLILGAAGQGLIYRTGGSAAVLATAGLVSALVCVAVAIGATLPTWVRVRKLADALEKSANAGQQDAAPWDGVGGEFGRMERSAQLLDETAHEKSRLELDATMGAAMQDAAIKQVESAERKRQDQQRTQAAAIADRAESSIQQSAGEVKSSAVRLQEIADGLAQMSHAAIERSHTTRRTTDETTPEIQQTAAAVTELSASVSEVSNKMSESAQMTSDASGRAAQINQEMQGLTTKTHEVGQAVEEIAGIAAMTNLLALNAAIEAASAGDAGRGFAVVADEVKELASQTAHATTVITDRVEAIRQGAQSVADEMNEMTEALDGTNQASCFVTKAVAEQSLAINEMAARAEVMAQNTSGFSEVVNELAGDAEAGGAAAEQLLSASGGLNEMADELSSRLSELLIELRSESSDPPPESAPPAQEDADGDDESGADDDDFFI